MRLSSPTCSSISAARILASRRPIAVDHQWQADIFSRGEIGQEMMKLKNKTHLRLRNRASARRLRAIDCEIAGFDAAMICRLEPAEQCKQSRLAGARRSHNCHCFTGAALKRKRREALRFVRRLAKKNFFEDR